MKGGVDCGNARKQDVNIKQYEKIEGVTCCKSGFY